jgi:hypothetical protein
VALIREGTDGVVNNRLIAVLGVGSGGTSCIAGILYALGVDMGTLTLTPRKKLAARNYHTYEDENMVRFRLGRQKGPDCGWWAVNRYRFDWHAYYQYRIETRGPNRPIGVKCSSGNLYEIRDDPSLKDQLAIVRVLRPLEDVIRAEDVRFRTANCAMPPEQIDHAMAHRAGHGARGWYATEKVCEDIPPTCEVDYEATLADPAATVSRLIDSLDLKPSPLAIETAVASVRPYPVEERR